MARELLHERSGLLERPLLGFQQSHLRYGHWHGSGMEAPLREPHQASAPPL
jgi:hypothetical protein